MKKAWAIVYDYVALHPYTTVRVALFCVAVTFWLLYFREIFFRSRGTRTQWLRKGLSDVLLVLSIAIITFLIFSLFSGFHPSGRRAH
jgi:hypothetical protein